MIEEYAIKRSKVEGPFFYNLLSFLFIDLIFLFPLLNKLNALGFGVGIFNGLQMYLLVILSVFFTLKKYSNFFYTHATQIIPFTFYGSYILTSLIIYFLISNLSVVNFFGEFFYSILPMSMIIIGSLINKNELKKLLKTILLTIFFTSLLTCLATFNIIDIPIFDEIFGNKYFNFSGIHSPIIYGYISQLCISILLLYPKNIFKKLIKYSLVVYFFIISILTLQKSPYLGIVLTLIILFLKKIRTINFKLNNLYYYQIIVFASILLILILGIFPINNLTSYLGNIFDFDFDLGRNQLISDEIMDLFNLNKVTYGREIQYKIFNNSILQDLFGMGFGRFSKLNDLNATSLIADSSFFMLFPDASYFRLLNEIGFFGLFTFVYAHISPLFKINNKSIYFFKFQLIIFTLFAFGFNRILWTSPSSFLFYFLLGTAISQKNKNIKTSQLIK